MASASATTIPAVDPSHVPRASSCVARVTVASIVLSPSSARKKAVPTVRMTEPVVWRLARSSSSAPRTSPRQVQIAKAKNASPATIEMTLAGMTAATVAPSTTEPRWMMAVAIVIATSTDNAGYLVAKASAISWLLSPSSAMKITPNDRRKASISERPGPSSPPAGEQTDRGDDGDDQRCEQLLDREVDERSDRNVAWSDPPAGFGERVTPRAT